MNIVGKKSIWLGISGIMLLVSVVSIFIWKLNFGIDFVGGTLLEIQFTNNSTSVDEIKNNLSDIDYLKNINIQETNENTFLIKTPTLSKDQEIQIKSLLNEKIGENTELRMETVGPIVSKDLTQKAILAVVLASIAIILYIAWAFRTVPKPASSWRFGMCAIIALIHDIIITIGAYSILGHFFGFEIDSLFVTALLTVMGFSVHDSIVVFDRIRENLRKYPSKDFDTNINDSIIQTLARSLNTSLTLIIVLLSLILLGGNSIKAFISTLLVGITIGTYSSIFNASIVLDIWQNAITKKNINNN